MLSKQLKMNRLLSGFLNKKIFFLWVMWGSLERPSVLIARHLSCDTSAQVALLINAETGKVLFAKNAEMPCYPASTTKIATALYTLYRKGESLDQVVTASSDAVGAVSIQDRRWSGKHPSYRLEFGGSHMGLKVNEQVDVKSLLYGLMLPSGNDAANVLAEAISGSPSQFVQELNGFLKEIGCKGTHFTNPHGLPDDEHVTTAKDLALMAQQAMKHPIFREIVSSAQCIRPRTNKQPESILTQNNALVKPGSKFFYPYATGIKTGYTIKSGHTIVASAQKNNRSLIAVVCHFEGGAQRYRSAIQLFEAAFQEVQQTRKLFSERDDRFSQQIHGAKDLLRGMLKQDVVVSFYPSEEGSFVSRLEWKELPLPIRAGEEVGLMLILDEGGGVVQKTPILAIKDVLPTFSYQVQEKMRLGVAWFQMQKVYVGYGLAVLFLGGAFYRFFSLRRRNVDLQ